ncbi:DNA-binding protein RHL1 [Prunus yedoensis var. nudiflora]|uniref:DNA-binding protein RHL1 n=1 Tax=Prunus yedoensis var. nudiflora TaxID=2094558 RepID=A0A314Y481_PRUYE|nr:DNA-binding protein RHL1 [Prunus yedoensis var. nudiflora]
MARTSSSKKKRKDEEDPNPEVTQRKRLKAVAFSNNLLSEVPAKPHAPLTPSNTVVKHHGKDILKKSQRKNRFLFSFPGLLAPIGGGKIGELKDLGTKNPVLYLDFPQGRMKLFGTIVFPKNRYLTMQFPRGGKSVMCEDYFDNMVVFSDAWWIGTQAENPEEAQLDFPKELIEGQHAEYDFKGGAGSTSANKQSDRKNETACVEHSPNVNIEDNLSDDGSKDLMRATPVRHSARTAGKRFNFGNASSGDDSFESDTYLSEGEDEKIGGLDSSSGKHASGNILIVELKFPNKIRSPLLSEAKSKKHSHSTFAVTTSVEDSHRNHSSLIQATISTLFKKVEKKKVDSSMQSQVQLPSSKVQETPKNPKKPASPKVSGQKSRQLIQRRRLISFLSLQDGRPKEKAKTIEEKDSGGKSVAKKKQDEVEEDDIEEFSSSSQDTDLSDEDWAA